VPESGGCGWCWLVLPGGSYAGWAEHEGRGYAEWLADRGHAAFVLDYRLGAAGYRHPVPLEDARQAMRRLRSRVGEWGGHPERVGVVGSSAGGHLAATLCTQGGGEPGVRPDRAVLCYPVITMGAGTHAGSRQNLLGDDPDPAQVAELSCEARVTPDTPPTFLWHAAGDPSVPVSNSLAYAAALAAAGVPLELHVYDEAHHGLGLGEGHPWTRELERWLAVLP
jgi:acetyl esterase/lipase